MAFPVDPVRRSLLAASAFAAPVLLAWPAAAAAPARIVVLDWAAAETLLALGAVPLAMAEPGKYRDWVPDPAPPEGVVDVGLLTEPNLELIDRLRPDIIVVGTDQEASIGHRLRTIAPLVPVSIHRGDGNPLGAAREETLRLAVLLGREAAGWSLLARTEQAFAAARQRLAGRCRRAVLVFLLQDERHGFVAGRNSLLQNVIDAIGLVNAWQGSATFWGFDLVGMTRLAPYRDADLLVGTFALPSPERALASPIWRALPAVRAGRTAPLPRFWYFAALPTAVRLAGLIADGLLAIDDG